MWEEGPFRALENCQQFEGVPSFRQLENCHRLHFRAWWKGFAQLRRCLGDIIPGLVQLEGVLSTNDAMMRHDVPCAKIAKKMWK